ncbi:tRNA-uridine aminocarboxypropyltransferase [Flavobacterium sp. W21_SRS_FM6]|uniref:tRNA-uridine aminocarboxypropyltransferase n=1 Tax=Flavobacterium sp. W21_SRS_FM6 TaxID=3240268 RepID=UPI003F909D57
MSHLNSVLQLRKQELTKSTRVFKARGNKVQRCEHCLVPASECICAQRPSVNCRSAVLFIMYSGEYFKPSNTGRIIADVIPNNHAFVWQRTEFDPQLIALLNDKRYQPIVVFPQQYAAPTRWISAADVSEQHASKIPLFVFLDGTWREAKKMFKSEYLANLPVLGIQPTAASTYQLREAAHLHQLCTAEVAIDVLNLAQDVAAATALATYFRLFRHAYMVHKPHLRPIE